MQEANDSVDMPESRQSLVEMARKVTVATRLKLRSINTTRMGWSKAPEKPNVLYLLSVALLPVLDYPMREAHFTLLSTAMGLDSEGAEQLKWEKSWTESLLLRSLDCQGAKTRMLQASTVNHGDRLIHWEPKAQTLLIMSRPRSCTRKVPPLTTNVWYLLERSRRMAKPLRTTIYRRTPPCILSPIREVAYTSSPNGVGTRQLWAP